MIINSNEITQYDMFLQSKHQCEALAETNVELFSPILRMKSHPILRMLRPHIIKKQRNIISHIQGFKKNYVTVLKLRKMWFLRSLHLQLWPQLAQCCVM